MSGACEKDLCGKMFFFHTTKFNQLFQGASAAGVWKNYAFREYQQVCNQVKRALQFDVYSIYATGRIKGVNESLFEKRNAASAGWCGVDLFLFVSGAYLVSRISCDCQIVIQRASQCLSFPHKSDKKSERGHFSFFSIMKHEKVRFATALRRTFV